MRIFLCARLGLLAVCFLCSSTLWAQGAGVVQDDLSELGDEAPLELTEDLEEATSLEAALEQSADQPAAKGELNRDTDATNRDVAQEDALEEGEEDALKWTPPEQEIIEADAEVADELSEDKPKAARPKKKAPKVKIEQTELAQETVLPVFEKVSAVKNKKITLSRRLEFGFGAGTDFLEIIYTKPIVNAHLALHLSELHAFRVSSTFVSSPFKSFLFKRTPNRLGGGGKGLEDNGFVEASLLPPIEMFIMGNYQLTPTYSKLSLFQNWDMIAMQHFFLGAGMGWVKHKRGLRCTPQDLDECSSAETKSIYPSFELGVGMSFYMNKFVALRADLRFMLHQWVNLGGEHFVPKERAASSANNPKNRWYFRSMLTGSLVFLLF